MSDLTPLLSIVLLFLVASLIAWGVLGLLDREINSALARGPDDDQPPYH